MNNEIIDLPNNMKSTLLYLINHDPGEFNHQCGKVCELQLSKSGTTNSQRFDDYRKSETEIANKFSEGVLAQISDISVIATPPSSTKQFKPYVDSLHSRCEEVVLVEEAFEKTDGFLVGDEKRTLDDVRRNITTLKLPATDANVTGTICFVDDIFSEGNTAAVILERLSQVYPNASSFVVACPLRVTNTPLPEIS